MTKKKPKVKLSKQAKLQLARRKVQSMQEQLNKDMASLIMNGVLDDESATQESFHTATHLSLEWADALEFKHLSFDPIQSVQAMLGAYHAYPQDLNALSDAEKNAAVLDINVTAIDTLLDQRFKTGFLTQSELFRNRLRGEESWDTLAYAALIEHLLRNQPPDADNRMWGHVFLVQRFFERAIHAYQKVEVAIAELREALELDTVLSLQDPANQLSDAWLATEKTHPQLEKYVDYLAEQTQIEARQNLVSGELYLTLFTAAELAPALAQTGAADRSQDQLLSLIYDQIKLMDIEVGRREEFYAVMTRQLQQRVAEQGPMSSTAASLIEMLDTAKPLNENTLIYSAYLGELAQKQAENMVYGGGEE